MQVIHDDTSTFDQQRVAISLARTSCKLWVDGSYYSADGHKAGAAVVVKPNLDTQEKQFAFIQAFNLTRMNLKKSTEIELWGATLALEQMKNFQVTEIVTDSQYARDRIEEVLEGRSDSTKHSGDLFDRLKAAISNQDDLHVSWVKRDKESIPVADKFAKAAAKKDIEKIAKHLNGNRSPCMFHVVSKKGNIKRTSIVQNVANDSERDGFHQSLLDVDEPVL